MRTNPRQRALLTRCDAIGRTPHAARAIGLRKSAGGAHIVELRKIVPPRE